MTASCFLLPETVAGKAQTLTAAPGKQQQQVRERGRPWLILLLIDLFPFLFLLGSVYPIQFK